MCHMYIYVIYVFIDVNIYVPPLIYVNMYVDMYANFADHNETARAKHGDVQSFCCDAYIAYLQHTVNANKTRVNYALKD